MTSRMNSLPNTNCALVLRTDFSDDEAWSDLCVSIQAPTQEFRARVECVSDRRFQNATLENLVSMAAQGPFSSFFFVVDSAAIGDPEHPILVVDLVHEPGRTFRVIPQEMWAVENNLSIANMDFFEFADNADADGVFRGFPSGKAAG